MSRLYDVRIFSNPQCKTPMRRFAGAKIAADSASLLVMDRLGDRTLDRLDRPKIEWIGADGIMLVALEQYGADRNGALRYKTRQVFCAYEGEQ